MKKKKKKKRGFTLIELLAVILILGIIALIAIPTVNNIISEAKKGAAKQSTTNWTKAVENKIFALQIDSDPTNDIIDGEYTVEEINALGLDIKGDIPTTGTIVIENGGVVSIDVQFGEYNVIYDGDKITIVDSEKEKVYENGEVVYFNPSTATKCSSSEASSELGTRDGCLRWHAILDSSNSTTIRLLLDHNMGVNVSNENATCGHSFTEVTPYVDTYWMSYLVLMWDESIRFSTRMLTYEEYKEITGAQGEGIIPQGFEWLYEEESVIDDSDSDGDIGYWIKGVNPSDCMMSYAILYNGTMYSDMDEMSYYGARPVITISKDLLK